MLADLWDVLRHARLTDLLDVLLIAFVLYYFLLLIKETKAYQLAIGLGSIAALFLITQYANLTVSNRLIQSFINYLIIAVIVLFQGEIRRFLTGIGSRPLRKPFSLRSFEEKMDDVFRAVEYLSQRKIGALIAIEKEISLSSFADRGTRLNAVLGKDILVSIFFPHSPMHDGAVIIRGDTIVAAGALLPLPATHSLAENFVTRTRHLAAIGLSQETDAAVIVVSEETGQMSLAARGRLERFEDPDIMERRLLGYLRESK